MTPLEKIKKHLEEIKKNPVLIAVTKGRSQKDIITLLEQGHRIFGESRLQEYMEKYSEIRNAYPDISMHFIGTLQKNKIRKILQHFDVIHSVNNKEYAEIIANEKINTKIFIQVNLAKEPRKSGIFPHEVQDFLKSIEHCPLNIQGLMCIPPQGENPHIYFEQLNNLAKNNKLYGTSMGMSSDYLIALQYGATHIRIGHLLFSEN